jgi:tRNA pseudouridine38-40 synthase
MRKLRLTVAYDGTDFHGWQRQKDGLPTVQGTLEPVLGRIMNHPVDLCAAGRTDAGVHALGQTVHFRTESPIPARNVMRAANARLPSAVVIVDAADAPPGFHATRCAVAKLYRYTLHHSPKPPTPMRARYVYHWWRGLDVEAMRAAAVHLLGRHDFSAFESAGADRLNKVRTILSLDVSRDGDEVRIDVTGDGFLYNMVRNIAGTLIEVGRGHWKAERTAAIVASRDRTQAGPTAPPQGLCLMRVRYPSDAEMGTTEPGAGAAPPE